MRLVFVAGRGKSFKSEGMMETMYTEVFSSRLKEARRRTGYTQVEVADKLGIAQCQMSVYENGKVKPDIELIAAMSIIYDVSVDWLFGLKAVAERN